MVSGHHDESQTRICNFKFDFLMSSMRIITFSLIAAIVVKTDAITLFVPMFVIRKSYPDSTVFQSERREAPVVGKCHFV